MVHAAAAAKQHGVRAPKNSASGKPHKTSTRQQDQAVGAPAGQYLNKDGTKGTGHAQQSGTPKEHGPSYVPGSGRGHGAANAIVNGHRGHVTIYDGSTPLTATQHAGTQHAATHRAPAKPKAPHAPRTPHQPKAHKAPKPPLQLNTNSFLGADSHVESHNPTPLVPVAVHRSSGFSLSHHR